MNGFFIQSTTWIVSAMNTLTGTVVANANIWYFLFLTCFIFVFFVKVLVVDPIGFYIIKLNAPWWETVIGSFLILGFMIFMMNQQFAQPMPVNWPLPLIHLLDGYKNTFLPTEASRSLASQNTWTIVPWLWQIGPIAFLYIRARMSDDDDND